MIQNDDAIPLAPELDALTIVARCYIDPRHEGWARELWSPDRKKRLANFDDRADLDRVVRRKWGADALIVACTGHTPRGAIRATLRTGRPTGGVCPLPPGRLQPGLYVFVLVPGGS